MPLSNTLARVDADLAAGRVPVARQRLRGLVSSFPRDLALRRRLAEVYRLYGDAAEAGRWMYLEEDRRADETAAFEERYGTPGRRMRALAWRGPEAGAGTAFAVERLTAVRVARVEASGRAADWDDPASYEDEDEGAGDGAPDSGGWNVAGVIVALGSVAGVVGMVAIWVIGVVALFE
ncbi:DUF6584 family protein [Streptomyces sp. NPDC059534]|uniref:DUF6584 family protein n=1 Tax=Streptomyces sp. NPDC059534 TaxID=3346859 RepID=UPI0036812A2E